MSKRNIVIAPCGNKARLFNDSWLKHSEERQFDLCLLFYHENIDNPALYEKVDFFFHLKGLKYHMIHDLLTRIHPEWLELYDYFYFLDDDIEIDTHAINRMFIMSKVLNGAICQASLSEDSFCSWPMFRNKNGAFCRFVGQVEVMAPLFEAAALKICMPSFIETRSSWGIDSVWPKMLGYPKDKLIVFDTIVMKHTLPVGGGELYKKIGADPYKEWEDVTEKYGAKKQNYQEYGRLLYVNAGNNRIQFWWFKFLEFVAKRKRDIHDYDLGSRIRNKKKKIFK